MQNNFVHSIFHDKPVLWKTFVVGAACVVAIGAVGLGAKGAGMALAAILGVLVIAGIMHRPWIGVAFIALTLPFERFGSLELSGFTLRMSQVLLLVTLAVVLWHVVSGRLRVRMQGAHIPLLVFVLGAILAMPHALNMFRATSSLVFMLFTMALAILIPTVLTSKNQIIRVLQALLVGACIASAFGAFQFVGDIVGLPQSITGLRDMYTKDVFGFPRIQSTALEPLYFANYLLLPLAIAIVSIVKRIRPLIQLSIVLIPLALPVFVLTLSRAAYIAGIIMLLALGAWLFRKIMKPAYIFLIVFVALITFVGVTYALSLTGEDASMEAFTRQATGLFIGASFADRASTSEQAMELIAQNPLGVGPGNFGPAVAVHPHIEPQGGWLIVNNIYLEILAEEGILGGVGMFAFVAYVLSSLVRRYRKADGFEQSIIIAVFCALVAIGVQFATFSILYIMHIWFALGIALALVSSLQNTHGSTPHHR